jgi:hypothetical protein
MPFLARTERRQGRFLIMLGEHIGEETGQITAIRVLPDEGHGPKVEVSFQANGMLLGAHVSTMGTYVSKTRPDGTLFGDGHGLVVTEHGERAAWHGQGVGHLTGHGTAVSYRGAVFYESTAERLARLNGAAAVFEYESDESGKITDNTWEWR